MVARGGRWGAAVDRPPPPSSSGSAWQNNGNKIRYGGRIFHIGLPSLEKQEKKTWAEYRAR